MYQVLIAEDESLIRTGIVSSIPWEQYNTTIAASCADGYSAWERFRELRPDIVITDLRMPGMSGQELIANIREIDSACRIIVITCLEDFDVIHSIIDKDLTAYLVKASIVTGDILSAVLRARDFLDARGEFRPLQNVESILRSFLVDKAINASVFDQKMHALLPSYQEPGCFLLTDSLTDSKRQTLQMSISLLGDCYMLDYYGRSLYLMAEPIDPAILAGCLKPLTSSGVRCVCRSMSSSSRNIQASLAKANSVFSSAYFYPDTYYDLTGAARTQPQLAREDITTLGSHPIVRGLLQCGNSMLRTSLNVMQSSFGINEFVFRSALSDVVSELAMYFVLDPEQILSSGTNAPSALRAILRVLPEYEHSSVYSNIIEKAIAYTAQTYTSATVKLADLASHCGFSTSYFALLFHKCTGLNFTDYLSILRIDAACRLLSETDLPINAISEQCGFSSTSYFTRYFSQRLGKSPKEWRKEHRL